MLAGPNAEWTVVEPSSFQEARQPYYAPPPRAAPKGLAGFFSQAQAQAQAAVGQLRGIGSEGEIVPPVANDTESSASRPRLPNTVLLNVYDVSDQELFQNINKVSTVNERVLIGGVFHAGVEIYGREWGYGYTEVDESGVASCPPRGHTQHKYRATVHMGDTPLNEADVQAVLDLMALQWRGPHYDLIHHNCLHFANAFCKALKVGRIPGWVDRFARAAGSLDNFYGRAVDGAQRTRQAAQGVSADIEQALPKLAEGMSTFGRGLFGFGAAAHASAVAAGRALATQAGAQPVRKDDPLRSALRNRGGVHSKRRQGGTAAPANAPTETEAVPDAVMASASSSATPSLDPSPSCSDEDPFLILDMPAPAVPPTRAGASPSEGS